VRASPSSRLSSSPGVIHLVAPPPGLNPCDNDAHTEISTKSEWLEKLVILQPISPGAVTLGLCSLGSDPKQRKTR
jgi:hypothetical protein